MAFHIRVGLVAAILCLAAAAASAGPSGEEGEGGRGHAYGLLLGDLKDGSRSAGSGNGHAYGLLLADFKELLPVSGALAQGDKEPFVRVSRGHVSSGGFDGVGYDGVRPPRASASAVPEPSGALLFGAGTALVALRRRRAGS